MKREASKRVGRLRRAAVTVVCLAGLIGAASAGAEDLLAQNAWRDKVDPEVFARLDDSSRTEFIAFLGAQADLSAARAIHGKERKGRYVFERLLATARATQGALLQDLSASGTEHRSFWVANAVWVRGDSRTLERVASRADVARVLANPRVAYERPMREFVAKSTHSVPWHLVEVGAPDVFWANGYYGQGAVVAGQDTGYDWQHPALRDKYRGANGNQVDHNYNWHDSIHTGGGVCGPDSPEPCDDDDHGTHTMGTMVGSEVDSDFGLAPEAKWMGCRNMDQGVGKPSTYTECFEWLLAPTDSNGQNPDPSMAPDVINNSWGCTAGEGCGDPTLLRQVVENVRAAGILVVVSAGNSGPNCGSVSAPPAIYDASLTVAATNDNQEAADFSSRGPVSADGSGRMKPDIAAPGVRVFSSTPNNDYALFQGTSMAAPHVAGMAALVLSAGACLRGDVDGLEQHLIANAAPHGAAGEECEGLSGSAIPNHVFGYGDLRAAMPSCPGAVNGAADGLNGIKVVCKDRTGSDKGKTTNRLRGASDWSCDGGAFAPEPGDKVQIRLVGKAEQADIMGGVAHQTDLTKVKCKNQKTKQSVNAELLGAGQWDCAAAGLEAEAGQKIIQTLVGKAK